MRNCTIANNHSTAAGQVAGAINAATCGPSRVPPAPSSCRDP
jgi:hypothetical protein